MAGIELLYFIVMLAVFVIFLVLLKVPAGISLMVSAIVGALIAGFGIPIRHLVEGTFGFIDPIMTIVAAMIFMVTLEKSGALDACSVAIVEKLHKYPTLLLIAFMIIIMFPAMITGSAIASIISSGALVAPIMIKIGIPRNKTAAIIALGAVLGMIAPPINIPVMLICDVVDMPYIGFTLPLLLLTLPVAIFSVLFIGRKYIKKIDVDELKEIVNFKIKEEVNLLVYLPILLLAVLIILQNSIPRYMVQLGLPLTFSLAAVSAFFCGKKFNVIFALKEGVKKSLNAMVLLMGVGMFVQIITLNGVRGFFVINALSLPNSLVYIGMALAVPVFAGISAYGSASVLGGPFVMALLGTSNPIIVASGISLLTCIGEFLPPTAMSATFSCSLCEEKSYKNILKAAWIPLIVIFVYAMIFVIFVSKVWN